MVCSRRSRPRWPSRNAHAYSYRPTAHTPSRGRWLGRAISAKWGSTRLWRYSRLNSGTVVFSPSHGSSSFFLHGSYRNRTFSGSRPYRYRRSRGNSITWAPATRAISWSGRCNYSRWPDSRSHISTLRYSSLWLGYSNYPSHSTCCCESFARGKRVLRSTRGSVPICFIKWH